MAAVRLLFVAVVVAAVAAFLTMGLASSSTTLDVPVIDLPSPTVPDAPLAPAATDPTPPTPPTPPSTPDEPVGSRSLGATPAVTISPPPVAHDRADDLEHDDRDERQGAVEEQQEDPEDEEHPEEDPDDEHAEEHPEDERRVEEEPEDEDPVDDDHIDI